MITAPYPEVSGRRLRNGQYLAAGEYIRSRNDGFFAIMQADGHFCVYRGTGPSDNLGIIWNTDVVGETGSYVAVLQDDGNFAVYRGTNFNDRHNVLWHAGCTGSGGIFQLVLNDQGRLLLFAGLEAAPNPDQALWWSDTSGTPGPGYVHDVQLGGVKDLLGGPMWQSFVPRTTGRLAAVDLELEPGQSRYSTQAAVLRVYEGEGVSGRLLHERRITVPVHDSRVYMQYGFEFAGPDPTRGPYVEAGQRYTLDIRVPADAKEPGPLIGMAPGRSADRSSHPQGWQIGSRFYVRPAAPSWSHPTG